MRDRHKFQFVHFNGNVNYCIGERVDVNIKCSLRLCICVSCRGGEHFRYFLFKLKFMIDFERTVVKKIQKVDLRMFELDT
jgi:hypothetical protein